MSVYPSSSFQLRVAIRWLSKDSRIVYTASGVPGSLAKGKAEAYSFKLLTERVPEEYQRVGFLQAWRAMRDGFYS